MSKDKSWLKNENSRLETKNQQEIVFSTTCTGSRIIEPGYGIVVQSEISNLGVPQEIVISTTFLAGIKYFFLTDRK